MRIAWAVAGVAFALCAAFLLPRFILALTPDTPVNLQVTPGQQPVIARLTWSPALGSSPASYRILVGLGAGGPYIGSYQTTTTSFDYLDGLGGIPYYFRVTAISAAGDESDYVQGGPVAAAWAATPHASATNTSTTCSLCHASHDSFDDADGRLELATSSPEPTALCYGCHNGQVPSAANVMTGTVDSFALPSGHRLAGRQSTSLVTTCASCHFSHGSAATSPMLPAQKINGVTITSNGPEWCEACHDESNSWYGPGYPSTSAPERDSSGYPTSGTWPGPDTYSSGSNAHRLIPETTQTVETGAEFKRFEGDCLYCHAAHGGPNKYDALRADFRPSTASTLASDQADGTYAALCFTCHGGVVPSGFATAPVDIKQFSTAATETAGHRIITAGGTLPVGAPLPCYDCHDPHGSKRNNALLFSDELGGSLETSDAIGVRHFCLTCHTTADNGTGWDSSSGQYVTVSSSAEVEGIPRTGGALKLPQLASHYEADPTSCETCHGSSYLAGGNNVHDPVAMGGFDAQKHVSAGGSSFIDLGLDDADHWEGDAPFGVTVACSLCHGTDLLTIHENSCVTCHSSSDDTVQNAIGAGDTNCTACHPNEHSFVSHQAVHDEDKCDCHGLGATSATRQTDQVDVQNCGACHTFAGVTDTIAPTTTSDAMGSYVGAATVNLTAIDLPLGGSQVAHSYYILDGELQTEGTQITIPAPSSGSVAHSLEFWSVDGDGNTELHHTVMFTVAADVTPPMTSSNVQPMYWAGAWIGYTWYYVYSPTTGMSSSPIQVVLSATDNGTYGVKTITYVLDGSQPITTTPSLDAGKWDSTVIIPKPTGVSEPHTLQFWSQDYSGNTEGTETVNFVTSLDETPPSVTCSAVQGQNYVGAQTFAVSADDGAGVGVRTTYYRLDGGTWAWANGPSASVPVPAPSSGSATHTIDFYATDTLYNGEFLAYGGASEVTFTVSAPAAPDTTPPTTTSSFNPTSGAVYNANQPVTLSAADNSGGSGVKTTYYNIDSGSFTAGTSFTVSGDGLHTFAYYSVDNAGNAETTHVSHQFRIDTTPPVTISNLTEDNTYTGDQTFTLTPTDTNGSGVANTSWQLDSTSGAWTSGTSVSVAAPSNGAVSHTLYFYSTDAAGNTETTKSVTFKMAAAPTDTTPPTTTSSFNPASGSVYATGQPVTLTATDETGGSGVKDTHYRIDVGPWTTGTSFTVSGDGVHTFSYYSVDEADNTETVHTSNPFRIDTTPPATTSDITPGGTYTGDQSFALAPTDTGGSGVTATYWQLDSTSGPWALGTSVTVSAPSSGSTSHTLYYYSTDAAGNAETTQSVSFTMQPGTGSSTWTTSTIGGIFVVPQGVTEITVDLYGDQGQDGAGPGPEGEDHTAGGLGGWVHAVIPVTPGELLTIGAGYGGYGNVSSGGDSRSIADGSTIFAEAGGGGGGADGSENGGPGGYPGALPGGNQSGADVSWNNEGCGGGGGWNAGAGSDNGNAGQGGTSYIAVGVGTMIPGVNYGGGYVNISYTITSAPDTTPPTTTPSFNPAAGSVYATGQPVTLTATDETGGSGVKDTYYRIDAGPWTTGTSFTVSGDGVHTFSYYSVDEADNTETVHTSNPFRIDTTAPVTTSDVTPGDTYTGDQSFTLTPTDTGGSGVASTSWQLDSTSGPWTSGTFVTVAAPSSGSTSHTLYYYSTDAAGNAETTQSVGFTVSAVPVPDTIPPTGTIDIDSGASFTATTAVTLDLSASDTGGSGLADMRFSNDGSTWSVWEGYATSKAWTLLAGDGAKTVWVEYRDGALNVSTTTISDTILLDTTPPVTTSDVTPGDTYTGDQSFTLTPTDTGGSGVASTSWQLDSTSGAWTSNTFVTVAAPSSGSTSHTLYFYSTDAAGNTETMESVSFTVVAPPDFTYVTQWGSVGSGDGQFHFPNDIAADDSGGVYVTVRDDNDPVTGDRLEKFDSDGNWIWTQTGFNDPEAMAIRNGVVYVAAGSGNCVRTLDASTGAVLNNSWATGYGLNYASGIAFDSAGNCYVGSYYTNAIVKYDSSGNCITSWTCAGAAGVAVDAFDNILAIDYNDGYVNKYTNTGTPIWSMGGGGSGPGQFSNPWGLSLDGQGNIYVADSGNNRVQKLDADGNYLSQWSGPDGASFNFPGSVAVDQANAWLYVCDCNNNRIVKAQLPVLSLQQGAGLGQGMSDLFGSQPTTPVADDTAPGPSNPTTADDADGGPEAQGPTVTIASPVDGAWLAGDSVSVSGSASDVGSGLSAVQLMIARSDGVYWTGVGWTVAPTWVDASGTTTWNYTWPLAADEEGTYTYTINARASDVAGDSGTSAGVDDLRVDNVAPTGTMSVNNNSPYINSPKATVDSSVADAGSGVTSMRADSGTGTYGLWVPYAASYGIPMPAGDGIKTVRVQYRDAAGNVATLADTILLDATPPNTTVTSAHDGSSYADPITLSAVDAGSGVLATYYTVDGGPTQTGVSITLPVTGSHTIVYWSVDNASNAEPHHTLANIRAQ